MAGVPYCSAGGEVKGESVTAAAAFPASAMCRKLDCPCSRFPGFAFLLTPRSDPPKQNFFKLCGQDAAALLKEWGPAKRRELLQSPLLCAPTECCVVEVGHLPVPGLRRLLPLLAVLRQRCVRARSSRASLCCLTSVALTPCSWCLQLGDRLSALHPTSRQLTRFLVLLLLPCRPCAAWPSSPAPQMLSPCCAVCALPK